MSGLILKSIHKRYGKVVAVEQVNLNLPDGQLIAFLGPSGCGKTTLLRMIAGLESVDSGEILIDGQDISHVPAHQRNFGMVFQSLALFPHMTVAQNIAYPLQLRHAEPAAQRERVNELLSLIQLEAMADRPVAKLSGGQRQRVAIARAIAARPKLLLLDEPLSALDAKLREAMQVEIRQLQRRLGITTILVTHDQREAMTMADQVVVLGEHRVQQVGAPIEVYRHPANEFVADFIGTGNVFGATAGDEALLLPGGASLPLRLVKPQRRGSALRLLVRPEDLALHAMEDAAAPDPSLWPATVTFVRDVGATIETTVDCAGLSLTALSTPRDAQHWHIGQRVGLHVPAQACRVLSATPAAH